MFGFIENLFIGLLASIVNASIMPLTMQNVYPKVIRNA